MYKQFIFDIEKGLFIGNNTNSLKGPEVIFFKSENYLLENDKPVLIKWKVKKAVSVSINSLPVALEGNMPFHSTKPTVLKLVAKGYDDVFVEKQIFIDVDKTPPNIEYFKTDRTRIKKGKSVILEWKVFGAKRVYIDNGIGLVSHKSLKTVIVKEDLVFTLTAESHFGAISQSQVFIKAKFQYEVDDIIIPNYKFKQEGFYFHLPSLNLTPNLNIDIVVVQQFLDVKIEYTQLNEVGTQILFGKKFDYSLLNSTELLFWVVKKQKEVSFILKRIWQKQIKKKLMRSLESLL